VELLEQSKIVRRSVTTRRSWT